MSRFFQNKGREAGCDEAGRGCLAGPVCASAVILDRKSQVPGEIVDSKKLSASKRDQAADWIMKHALSWAVAYSSPLEIDRINILNASIQAMHRALDGLTSRPERILVDGHRFHPYRSIAHHCIIGGDGIYSSISAASILAKVHRDRYMQLWHEQFPQYDWHSNKGYPTAAHIEALRREGPSPMHRKSFRLKSDQLQLDL